MGRNPLKYDNITKKLINLYTTDIVQKNSIDNYGKIKSSTAAIAINMKKKGKKPKRMKKGGYPKVILTIL